MPKVVSVNEEEFEKLKKCVEKAEEPKSRSTDSQSPQSPPVESATSTQPSTPGASIWTQKAMERAAAHAAMPKSPVAKRESKEKPLPRFYPVTVKDNRRNSKKAQKTNELTVSSVGWVLGTDSLPKRDTNPAVQNVTHPSVVLFQDNGFEPFVSLNISILFRLATLLYFLGVFCMA